MKFAYVSFVNDNQLYIELMKTTIDSVLKFSKHVLIIYLVNVPENKVEKNFPKSERIIYRHINNSLPSIYYYKPWIIIDSIRKGLESGFYIEADDILTPNCDTMETIAESLSELPISQIHPSDCTPSANILNTLGVIEKTQPYIHAHVLFKNTNIKFLEEWLEDCMKVKELFWDESALNCMYWKYNCKNHYLPHDSPWHETFYSEPNTRSVRISYHGCKDPKIQRNLFNDMVEHYTSN